MNSPSSRDHRAGEDGVRGKWAGEGLELRRDRPFSAHSASSHLPLCSSQTCPPGRPTRSFQLQGSRNQKAYLAAMHLHLGEGLIGGWRFQFLYSRGAMFPERTRFSVCLSLSHRQTSHQEARCLLFLLKEKEKETT